MTIRKTKVYGGQAFYQGEPHRVIVRTTSKRKAVEELSKVINISLRYFNDYWSETGNEKEISLTRNSESVFARPIDDWSGKHWKKISK